MKRTKSTKLKWIVLITNIAKKLYYLDMMVRKYFLRR